MRVLIFAVCFLLSPVSQAADAKHQWKSYKDSDIAKAFNSISKREGIKIIVDPRLKDFENTHGFDYEKISMNELMSILSVSGYTIQRIGNLYKVLSYHNMKKDAIKVIEPRDDLNLFDELVVTTVVPLKYTEPKDIVPALRPQVPMWTQLSSAGGNEILLTATYGKVKKLMEVIEYLDVKSP